MYVYRVNAWGLWQSEVIEFPGTRVMGTYESPGESRELNGDSLQEQQILLATEPSL